MDPLFAALSIQVGEHWCGKAGLKIKMMAEFTDHLKKYMYRYVIINIVKVREWRRYLKVYENALKCLKCLNNAGKASPNFILAAPRLKMTLKNRSSDCGSTCR